MSKAIDEKDQNVFISFDFIVFFSIRVMEETMW